MTNRIYRKTIQVLDKAIISVYNIFERIGFVKPIPFKSEQSQNDIIQINHSYPVNIKEKDKPLFNEWKTYPTFENKLFVLENVNLSNRGIIFKSFKCFVPALPHPVFKGEFGFLYITKRYLFEKKQELSRDVKYFVVLDNWAYNNYYHWMIDSMCRLIQWRSVLNNYTILIQENAPKFIMDTLFYLKIDKIEIIKSRNYVSVPRLTVPNYCAWPGQQHPLILKKVKEFILESVKEEKGFERIYISRAKQKSRRVANEKELVVVLKQNNFEIIYFEGMSLAEQISIVKNAKYFVSSHGANMTNALFTKNAKVFEFLRKDKPNFCYWSTLTNLNIPYYYQLCEIESNDHLLVDIEQFKINLHQLLND